MTATIYALVDPRDQSVRYIGKANDPAKRLASHMRDSTRRDTPVYRWIRKLAALGMSPTMEVIVTCSVEDWPAMERRAIATLRAAGARLLNVAEGGDEPYCSPEVRKQNARVMNSSRPVYVMRAYRQLEYHLRVARKISPPERVAKFEAIIAKFKAWVASHRMAGTLAYADEKLSGLFVGRPSQVWK